MLGQLNPLGGGDTIPLLKEKLLVGRRESCDICLRFDNVSAHHCQLFLEQGYWFVKDLNSRNGVKVNGQRVARKRLDPGSMLSIARQKYEIAYSPFNNGASGPPPPDEGGLAAIMKHSLLDRAGLKQPARKTDKRYEMTDDDQGSSDSL